MANSSVEKKAILNTKGISNWGKWSTLGQKITLFESLKNYRILWFWVGWDTYDSGISFIPVITYLIAIGSNIALNGINADGTPSHLTIKVNSFTELEIVNSRNVQDAQGAIRQVFGMN